MNSPLVSSLVTTDVGIRLPRRPKSSADVNTRWPTFVDRLLAGGATDHRHLHAPGPASSSLSRRAAPNAAHNPENPEPRTTMSLLWLVFRPADCPGETCCVAMAISLPPRVCQRLLASSIRAQGSDVNRRRPTSVGRRDLCGGPGSLPAPGGCTRSQKLPATDGGGIHNSRGCRAGRRDPSQVFGVALASVPTTARAPESMTSSPEHGIEIERDAVKGACNDDRGRRWS